jgi:serine/threonine protein kinase
MAEWLQGQRQAVSLHFACFLVNTDASEQAHGLDVTPATGIYSFGATIYHLITGRPPSIAENAMEVIRCQLHYTPRPLSQLRASVSRDWDVLIVDRCMAKNPTHRPETMAEVIARMPQLWEARS